MLLGCTSALLSIHHRVRCVTLGRQDSLPRGQRDQDRAPRNTTKKSVGRQEQRKGREIRKERIKGEREGPKHQTLNPEP
eukprot:1422228-Rhodomonas_salina.2